jgi:integrase
MVDPPTVEPVVKIPLSAAELAALRYVLRHHRLAVLYELGWALGLRLGGLLGLALSGLDLKAGTITIAQQVLDVAGGPSIEPYTKNNRIRTLPLTPRLSTLIRVRLAQLLKERGRDDWSEHGLLFPSERGTPMSERNFERQFDGRCVQARVRLRDTGKRTKKGAPIYASDMHPHLLRHTALSWLGDTGASDMVIKAIAGHADRNVTDRYVHVSLDAMREALVRMECAKLLTPDDQSNVTSDQAEVG